MTKNQSALVIDDEPAIARTVSLALQSDDWQVDSAGSGESALPLIANGSYDLILLDLRLPGIQGTEVLKRMEPPVTRPKVVVMTAYGSPECAIETMRLGAADILRKPFSPGELRAVVESVMSLQTDAAVLSRRFDEQIESAKDCIRQQRIPRAMELAGQALTYQPERPEAFHLLGVCHDLLGERLAARKMYGLALEVDPAYRPARKNLDRLVFLHGLRGSVELE